MIDAAHIRDWLCRQALPLWSHAGLDSDAGGFVEKLTLDGRPVLDTPKRLRVQARQVYVYSHAHLLGWTPPEGGPTALDCARHGFDFLTRQYWREDGGFIFAAERNGAHADTRIESYEQAFAIFAFAWYFRASGDEAAAEWAERTLSYLDDALGDLDHGGYHENLARDLPRRQNPHMHLLEALLAWYDATGEGIWLRRADDLFGLFRARFFQPDHGALGEFFEADWSPAPGTMGKTVEPGHHHEWVWLLHQYARAGGADVELEAEALYRFAETHGTDHEPGPASGLAFDSVLRHGTSLDENKRLWVQAEAIKAQVARMEFHGDAQAAARLEELLDRLFTLYLAVGHGNWQDHLDKDGQGFAETAPASSFYHLFLALTEVLRVRDGMTSLG
ncbi:MAG: AGE family epimerase/isomerase [Alphaproteobacteria bacterium]|nr:AGE family epimerase/isomerase [Alphaproteobacteria bacterium]